MDFQHSRPQSVYRGKNYKTNWAVIPIHLLLALASASRVVSQPSIWNVTGMLCWLFVAFQTWRQNRRNRLVMSPAGISLTWGRSAATPWSNVERVQVIRVGTKINLGHVPCLVLREPAEGTLKPLTRGVPDELKGRVIPLYLNLWERIGELEQELYGYLPADSDGGRLSVPHSFAAINQRQERISFWIIAAIGLIPLIAMYLYLYFTS
ncbi:MAG TPA: hypothetical protein VD886_03170 [Herpetosiphonaceae bacterium]|nr:hypothetical protein [Herpetosiphonaceae bacterium]